jgi:transcriptional regulator with XRE-family HTH domain
VTHRDTPSNPLRPQDTPLRRFGATLRQYRKQRRLSQPALAARTGIHHTYISEIEHGLHNISVLMLLRLAHALEIPVASLLAQLVPHAALAPSIVCDPLPYVRAQDAVVTHDDMPSSQPSDPAMLLPLFGTTLRHYRQQRRLSQRALATRTSLAASYICGIEQGQRNVSVLSVVRLADALGLSVAHLLSPLETRQSSSHPFIK